MSFTPADNVVDAKSIHSTPLKKNLQGSARFGPVIQTADIIKKFMAQETEGEWVGPMPPQEFLDDFLPRSRKAYAAFPLPDGANPNTYFSGVLPHAGVEKYMYVPLINRINKSRCFPGFKLVNTSTTADTESAPGKKTQPDISWCEESSSMWKEDDKDDRGQLDWGTLKGFMELKSFDRKCDPFHDPLKYPERSTKEYHFESDSNVGTECRGQITAYATQMAARQHLTHSFAIYIGNPYVRFIRFDRTGGVVSEKFDINTQGELLLQFFWRFAHLNPVKRGQDMTVRPADDKQKALAIEHLSRWKPRLERPVLVMDVPDGRSVRKVIAWGSLAEPESLTGRATRGYPVFDIKLKKVVFLKDSWRATGPGMEKESEILKELNQKCVRNVPPFLCGDDIRNQVTVTKEYASKAWNRGAKPEDLCDRAHIRFCEDFVGHHLETFTSSKQFLRAVFHAFQGHQDAYELCGILHRDISAGNIMIDDDGNGILNDWDLARRVSDVENGPRQAHRSGTWQFMSYPILNKPNKIHEAADDIESFFYVVLYFVLRYMTHTKVKNVGTVMNNIFEAWYQNEDDGLYSGGSAKAALVASRTHIGGDFKVVENPPMSNWLEFAIRAVRSWHVYIEPGPRSDLDWMPVAEPNLISVVIKDHRAMVIAFEQCLAAPNWPACDPAKDNIRPKRKSEDDVEPNEFQPTKKARTGVTTSVNIVGRTGPDLAASIITPARRPATDDLPQRKVLALRQKSGRGPSRLR